MKTKVSLMRDPSRESLLDQGVSKMIPLPDLILRPENSCGEVKSELGFINCCSQLQHNQNYYSKATIRKTLLNRRLSAKPSTNICQHVSHRDHKRPCGLLPGKKI